MTADLVSQSQTQQLFANGLSGACNWVFWTLEPDFDTDPCGTIEAIRSS